MRPKVEPTIRLTDLFRPTEIVILKYLVEHGSATAQPWEEIVLYAAAAGFEFLDRQAPLSWSLDQVDAALCWMVHVHLHASDNIIRRKRLEQPAHCVGVLQ